MKTVGAVFLLAGITLVTLNGSPHRSLMAVRVVLLWPRGCFGGRAVFVLSPRSPDGGMLVPGSAAFFMLVIGGILVCFGIVVIVGLFGRRK